MLWHEQSWPAIAALDKNLPVVVPTASCEQHGRHLPLFVDTIQLQAIVDRVNQVMGGKVIVLPVLWLGCAPHHADYPGTLTLPPSLYSQVIMHLTRGILRAGFRRVFFLNGHGGNETPISQALTELVGTDAAADGAQLAMASWWQVGAEGLDPRRQGMTTPQLSHACEYETSFMLALRPDLVKMEQVQEQSPVVNNAWYHSERGGKVRLFHRTQRFTGPGGSGAPMAASAEKGRAMFDAVCGEVVKFLGDFANWPMLPELGSR